MKAAHQLSWKVGGFFALVLGLLLLSASDSRTQSRLLDRIEVSSSPSGPTIRVKFNELLSYVSHTPDEEGAVIQVELRSTPGPQSATDPADIRETMSWKPTKEAPLTEVLYEALGPASSTLSLRFTRPVRFRIEGGSDLRSIVVTLAPSPGSAGKNPGTVDETSDVPEAAASVPNLPSSAVEETVAQEPEAGASIQSKTEQAKASSPEAGARFKPYAINLSSTVTPVDPSRIPTFELPEGLRFYTSQFEKGGTVWNRLRLGFFSTPKAAKELIPILDRHFPGAWVSKVTRQEWALSARQTIVPSGSKVGALPPPSETELTIPIEPTGEPLGREKAGDLLAEARAAMTSGDLRRAIQIFTKILRSPDQEFHQDAKELLGLARERNGQFAHAKAEYEEYLKLYPEGEGAARVKQRLAGVLTARSAPRERLGGDEAQVAGASEWDFGATGSLAQFYRRDEVVTDDEGRRLNISELSTDLDLIGNARSDWLDSSFRFTGGYVRDFAEENNNDTFVAALYTEALSPQYEVFGRVGRQTRSSDGVLGRFDGAFMSYQLVPSVQLNVVGGFPVDRSTDLEIDTDRYFYGISIDLGPFFESLDTNVYVINQITDGILDRRAVGAEARYFDTNYSAFLLLDYDVSYNALNLAVFGGTYIFPDQTTLNLSLDYRKSPILTTTNALQGQGADSISSLRDDFSVDEIRDLAEDRTADSKAVTIGASRPLNENFQISSDFTWSTLSSTETSGGVEGTPSTGNEFFYSIQLIGTSLIKEGDIATLGFRYADTSSSDRFTFDINTRYPVTRDFQVSPRLQNNYRINDNNDGRQISIRPSVRLTYFWERLIQPELEIGGEWLNDRQNGESSDEYDFFISVGYRLDF